MIIILKLPCIHSIILNEISTSTIICQCNFNWRIWVTIRICWSLYNSLNLSSNNRLVALKYIISFEQNYCQTIAPYDYDVNAFSQERLDHLLQTQCLRKIVSHSYEVSIYSGANYVQVVDPFPPEDI